MKNTQYNSITSYLYNPKPIQLAQKINFSKHCLWETFLATYRTALTVSMTWSGMAGSQTDNLLSRAWHL